MVILSLPSMSNSFLGHPDKGQFSAESSQAILIRIKHVRYWTLICRFDSSLCRKVFIVALMPIHGRSPSNPAAVNFGLADKNSFLSRSKLSSPNLSPPDYVEGDGHL
jgi:hypothetical protein